MSDDQMTADDAFDGDAFDALEDELPDTLDDEFGEGELDGDEDDLAEDDFDDSADDPGDDTAADPAAALDAVGDSDDEGHVEPVVDLAAIDGLEAEPLHDDDTDDDAIRDDEFVCRSCHMARKGSALADPDAMLCRDCV